MELPQGVPLRFGRGQPVLQVLRSAPLGIGQGGEVPTARLQHLHRAARGIEDAIDRAVAALDS